MARTAEDVRLLFEVTAGDDDQDPFSAPVPLRRPDLAGLRIGLMERFGAVPVEPAMREAVKQAGGVLEQLGFAVEPYQPRGIGRAPDLWWFFFAELAAPFIRQMVEGREQDVHWTGSELVNMALEKPAPTMRQVIENLGARDAMRAALLRQMREVPVLLLPACGVAAFPHRTRSWQTGEREIGLLDAMAPLTFVNLLGLPAMVIPFGRTEEGLPVGVQLVAGPYGEELLLELAVRMEEARGPFGAPEVNGE